MLGECSVTGWSMIWRDMTGRSMTGRREQTNIMEVGKDRDKYEMKDYD